MSPTILFLVGPTGSGKSEVGISLAKALNGEIISADSMLVYRGMNVGTAKPSRAERKGIVHHLIDIVSPRELFSVNRYRTLALEAFEKIVKRNRLPIVVGGSGLYIRALTDGLAPQEKGTQKIRAKLERQAKQVGISYLYKRLKKIDPVRAAEILSRDQRRIIRSLEIYDAFGIKPSEWRLRKTSLEDLGFHWTIFGIRWEREELYDRINQRVDRMMEQGFLKEVKRLSKKGMSRTARQAIGYHELHNYLKGKMTLEQAIHMTKQRTRHLAKKQLIWFRKEKRIRWIDVHERRSFSDISTEIINSWQKTCPLEN